MIEWIIVFYLLFGVFTGLAFEINERMETGKKGWGILGGCFWPVTITGLGIKWVSNKLDTATKVCEELETKKEKEAREQAELLQRVDRMIAEKDKTYAPTSQEDWELEARKTEYETGL